MKSNYDSSANQRYATPANRDGLRFNRGHQAPFCTEAQVNGYAEHLASELAYRCEAE